MEEFEKLLTETATLQYKLQKLQKQEIDLRRNVLFMKTQHAQLFPDEDGLQEQMFQLICESAQEI